MRRPRHQLHRADRRAAAIGRPASARRPRSTWSATSAAAGCSWPSGCWRRSWSASDRAGQVVDAAMVDGAALLVTDDLGLRGARAVDGRARRQPARRRRAVLRHLRGRRRPDIAVGALEPQFYAAAAGRLGIAGEDCRTRGPLRLAQLRDRFTEVFVSRTRDEWAATFAGTDACVTPVLSFGRPPRPAPHRPRHADQAGRDPAGRAGPPVLPDPGGHAVPSPGPRRRHQGRAGRLGRLTCCVPDRPEWLSQPGAAGLGPYEARWRLMTRRWIWFVPSKICMIFASRRYRSTGNSWL